MAVRRRSVSAPAWHFSKSWRYNYYSPEKLKKLEKGFILDGVPLSKLANDEAKRTHPTLNLGIPQYMTSKDPHCQLDYPCGNRSANISMMGSMNDKLLSNSDANEYMENRKNVGAGYCRKLYGGHMSLLTDAPKPGYHGNDGYRRNTPELRSKPSSFDCEDFKVRPALSTPEKIQWFRMRSALIYNQAPMEVTKKASAIVFT